MPELQNRDDTERRIIGELEPIFEAQYRRALATPTTIDYSAFQAELTATMSRELSDVFTQAGAVLLLDNAVVVSGFEQTGQRWAAGFAPTLAGEVVSTSRQLAAEAVRQAGGDRRKTAEGLALVFMSDARLENIAATEVTRAVSASEHTAVAFIHSDGSRPRLIPIWRTAGDSNVCEHCFPFNRKSRAVWGELCPMGPPFHVRCRCWLDWVPARQWAAA